MINDIVIMVVYIKTNNMSAQHIKFYMEEIKNTINRIIDDNRFKVILIPVEDQETRMECIYPTISQLSGTNQNIILKLYEEMLKEKYNDSNIHTEIKGIVRKLKIDNIKNGK